MVSKIKKGGLSNTYTLNNSINTNHKNQDYDLKGGKQKILKKTSNLFLIVSSVVYIVISIIMWVSYQNIYLFGAFFGIALIQIIIVALIENNINIDPLNLYSFFYNTDENENNEDNWDDDDDDDDDENNNIIQRILINVCSFICIILAIFTLFALIKSMIKSSNTLGKKIENILNTGNFPKLQLLDNNKRETLESTNTNSNPPIEKYGLKNLFDATSFIKPYIIEKKECPKMDIGVFDNSPAPVQPGANANVQQPNNVINLFGSPVNNTSQNKNIYSDRLVTEEIKESISTNLDLIDIRQKLKKYFKYVFNANKNEHIIFFKLDQDQILKSYFKYLITKNI